MIPRIAIDSGVAHRVGSHPRRELGRRLWRAGRRVGIERERLLALAVRIVDDAEMSSVNLQYRGEETPTDVLSFGVDPDTVGELLGDILLNWDAVCRQARGPTSAEILDEATVLCVHGLVHLLGHDHATRREARSMLRIERRALAATGARDVPRPYGP